MEVTVIPVNGEDNKRRISMRIYILPNLLTTGNLFCGFYAIMHAIKGDFSLAAKFIVGASIFDLLDGRLARLTRSTSKFGAEYDSLCDLCSFGMAPGILLYQWSLHPYGRLGQLAAFLYVTCGALRLARFNVQANIVEKSYFQGLPIPMAAGIVASSILAFTDLEIDPVGHMAILIMTFFLAFVMVSTFRYRSFKDLDLKERHPFQYLVAGVLLFVLVWIRPELNLFLLFIGYALLGALGGLLRWGKSARKIRASVYLPAHVNSEHDLISEEFEDEAEDNTAVSKPLDQKDKLK